MAISKSDKHELGKRERKRSEANAPCCDLILDEILFLILDEILFLILDEIFFPRSSSK